jgi:hypothetical protein
MEEERRGGRLGCRQVGFRVWGLGKVGLGFKV